jgi:uroporphyrinogen decarboxylase
MGRCFNSTLSEYQMEFQNDYRHMLSVLANRRPNRLPIYEHHISPVVMEKILGTQFAQLINGEVGDVAEFFHCYCRFFQQMTYDTVSFEVGIAELLPDHGAIMGGRPGPIQNRADFEKYPWEEVPEIFWKIATPRFEALIHAMPAGMKAVGGPGYGVFEISEDLVGFQYLSYMQADDPELFVQLYEKIGDLFVSIWRRFLELYRDHFAICRMGDDLGFKTSTLISPAMIRTHIFPQYRRIIGLIKSHQKPFLWHSCGNIFPIMEDAIALGIDAKHSNEDCIAPFDEWISRYGHRIGLLGGIDVDLLCQKNPVEITSTVFERGRCFRQQANGFALGSGNSIPEYVPSEGYLAMIEGAKKIRAAERIQ